MKRVLTTAAIAATLAGGAMSGHQANTESPASHLPAAGKPEQTGGWRETTCRGARLDGEPRYSIREVAWAIDCATGRWDVPGGTNGALCIARHESGLRPDARNPSGASGVYQFIPSTYRGAYDSHPDLVGRWDLRDSVWNARTNVVLAIRHAHDAWSWSSWHVDHLCDL